MTKNYREPEFKVVEIATEDVVATSLDKLNDKYDTSNKDGVVGFGTTGFGL